MSISVELGLDEESTATLRRLWRRAEAAGRGRALSESPGQPHLSLALFAEHPGPEITDLTAKLAAGVPAFDLVISHAAAFDSAEGVVYLAPSASRELQQCHLALHDQLRKRRMVSNSLYEPECWTPHWTVAVGVEASLRAEVTSLAHVLAPRVVRVSYLRVFDHGKGEMLAEHLLPGGGSESRPGQSQGSVREPRGVAQAEMAYAHFNALRTAVSGTDPGIARGKTATFEYLLDPARPADAYYNRAVALSGIAISKVSILELPQGVVSLEFAPAHLTSDAIAWLREFGFTLSHRLCYMAIEPTGGARVDREVVRFDPSQADRFLDLLQLQGAEFPPEKRERKRSYYCTDRFRAYAVTAGDGVPCSWATMFVEGTTAFLGNSFTLPPFRRQGAHAALIAARLNAASADGIEVAYTDVEPGSQSHANCERAGFRTLALNSLWTRAPGPVPDPPAP